MRKVSITNLYDKVWRRKKYFPQVNYIRSLMKPALTRQTTFEVTDSKHDLIKD